MNGGMVVWWSRQGQRRASSLQEAGDLQACRAGNGVVGRGRKWEGENVHNDQPEANYE